MFFTKKSGLTAVARIAAALLALPAMAAAERACPWLNAATAGGFLGGEVQVTVTPAACEFVRQHVTLRIEVTPVSAPHANCGSDAEQLKAIGNEAVACSYRDKSAGIFEQIVGRVRDQVFLVRFGNDDRSAAAKTLREKARALAEAVAGILY
jgi:hypothetical protein